jgi:hypothetical protein
MEFSEDLQLEEFHMLALDDGDLAVNHILENDDMKEFLMMLEKRRLESHMIFV